MERRTGAQEGASAPAAPPVPGSDCMDAAAMSPGLHSRGIHAVRTGGTGAVGRVAAVTESWRSPGVAAPRQRGCRAVADSGWTLHGPGRGTTPGARLGRND